MFEQVARAIAGAKKFILFADWQMDYDVELTERGSPRFSGRLSELLAKKIAEGVEVKVLLYDSVEAALYTHENHVRLSLMRLNPTKDEVRRGVGPKLNPAGNLPVEVALQKPMTGRAFENIVFAHHQKTIVVDGTQAFVGGMDLCYGRWCDANFDVVIDPVLHRINDIYNPGLPGGRLLTSEETRITKPWTGEARPTGPHFGGDRPGFAPPYYIIGTLIDRAKELWDKGYSIDQICILLDTMAIPDQVANYFKSTYRRLRALAIAIDRTLDEYTDEKTNAYREILNGHIVSGYIHSVKSDLKLLNIVAKQLNLALDAALESALDWSDEQVANAQNWFRDTMRDIADDLGEIERYAQNPALLKQDALRLWQDIKDLPSQIFDNFALEEGCQPRMPWQDVHCLIEGPAAFDVYRNFVYRWNVSVHRDKENATFGIKPLTHKWLGRWGGQDAVFNDVTQHGSQGKVTVQIVRSMSASLLRDEAKHTHLQPLRDAGIKAEQKEQYANEFSGNMDGVLEAMVHAIRGSEAYIYIESQFFLSDCAKSSSMEPCPSKNELIDELAARIGVAIQTGRAFHVYVVLPVHPEGNLNAGSVAKQHYWALQSIKHGKASLIRRICRLIAWKKQGKEPSTAQIDEEVENGRWADFLTFLNLRSWGVTAWFERDANGERKVTESTLKGQFVITEQVYVHSKLMIVDDAIAIIGSANLNDRSLQGDGDTEIAAVIVDNDIQRLDLGNGHIVNTRKFARELRKSLWRKHLGMDIDPGMFMRGDRPGKDNAVAPPYANKLPYPPRREPDPLPKGVDLDKPAANGTRQAIQTLADNNARTYTEVFQHVPTDAMKRFADTEAGWPTRFSRVALTSRVAGHYARGLSKDWIGKLAPKDIQVVDFSTVPPKLNDAYMRTAKHGEARPYDEDGNKVHDVGKAITLLQSGGGDSNGFPLEPIAGFWVSMPLDFGIDEHDVWLGGEKGDFVIAKKTPREPEERRIAEAKQPDIDEGAKV